MRILRRVLTLGAAGWVGLMMAAVIAAQAPLAASCGEQVRQALQAANAACEGVERNQICYGNLAGSVVPRNLSLDLEWDAVGDRLNLNDIAGLTLSPMESETEQWGVAVMAVQASLPDTLPDENVTILLFGNVIIEDAAADPSAANPMQAFYLKNGTDSDAVECAEAPTNGIVIQTPKGLGLIELTINGVNVSLGSTALFTLPTSGTGGNMRVTLLEGLSIVESGGKKQVIVPGSQTEIALDEDGQAVGEPSDLVAYDAEQFIFYDEALQGFGVELPVLDENFEAYLAAISERDWNEFDFDDDFALESEPETISDDVGDNGQNPESTVEP